jgi:predicted DNA-binding transcriptional regulator AlpA
MATNLLNETEVSQRLHVSLACLRRWRLEKRGPQFIKVGALVRYRPEVVEAWLASLPTGGSGVDGGSGGGETGRSTRVPV